MSTKRSQPLALAHTTLTTPLGEAHLFGTAHGILTIALPNERREAALALAERLIGPYRLTADVGWLTEGKRQMADYFAGTGHTFTAPLDLRGTPSQRDVWLASLAIPYGETRTYGAIAAALGRATAARAVGRRMAQIRSRRLSPVTA